MIFGFKDNKCKGKVYTQEEVDNLLAEINTVQSATITIEPTVEGEGIAELTFKKVGKVVYLNIKLTAYANYNFPYWSFKIIDIPDFAKTNARDMYLINSSVIGGFGLGNNDGDPITINDLAKAWFVVDDTGRYIFTGYIGINTPPSEQYSVTLSGCYLVE